MEPFARQKKSQFGRRRLILAALAAGSLSIWYFDLIPQLTSVPTGELPPTTENGIDEDQFLAMLEGGPKPESRPPQKASETTDSLQAPDASATEPEAELMAALAQQQDPLAAEFPELAAAGQQATASETAGPESPVQQASFETLKPAAPPKPEPKTLPAEIAEVIRQADDHLDRNQILEAHAALSRLYWKKPEYREDIVSRLESTAARIYADPTTHFAEPYFVQPGDTLSDIAAKYKVPWQYLARLNRTTPEKLQAGQKLKVLTGPFGAVVDLDEFQLTVHAHGWFVRRYRIGIGADGSTPVGEYKVQDKLENPTWFRPEGGRIDADDPQNPLGEYWLGLGNHLGIHGTIDPSSIGSAVSRGCIHLADDDIAEIFQLLDVGSPVTIRR